MKGITYCGACADYDTKKHRCKRGAMRETNPQDKFFDDCPLPTVKPLVHGKWLRSDDDWYSLTAIRCSICGEEWCFEIDDDVTLLNYKHCPNCGAKMDGGTENGKTDI